MTQTDLEHKATELLQYAAELSAQYYNASLIVTYSGGKDSEVLLSLHGGRESPLRFNITTRCRRARNLLSDTKRMESN